MCTVTWCTLNLVQWLPWWWLYELKHVATFVINNNLVVFRLYVILSIKYDTAGWLQLKKNVVTVALYREHLVKKLLLWKAQVHHHGHKFMELESALRPISLCCMWMRDAFQSCFLRNKLFPNMVTLKILFLFFGTSSCDQVCNVCICTRRHISSGGRVVIQNNFGLSLATKFAWLNDQ
jgi:hypothetical protein